MESFLKQCESISVADDPLLSLLVPGPFFFVWYIFCEITAIEGMYILYVLVNQDVVYFILHQNVSVTSSLALKKD